MSIGRCPARLELGELLGLVAAGEDAGVDRAVERLDLAADERAGRRSGSETGRDLDAVRGEVLAGPVGREELDVERLEVRARRR